MKRAHKQVLTSLVAGALFGVGLAVSGMTQPRKVIGFLDFAGAWDPSLAFVMLGAVAVHFLAYRWVRGSAAPLFADEFSIPSLRRVDAKLVAGAALFGVGWGLAGYCPGPALVSLGSLNGTAVVFVAMFIAGTLLGATLEGWRARRRAGERRVLRSGALQGP